MISKFAFAQAQAQDVQSKQELDRVIQARKQAAARGGGALTSFGGPNAMGPPIPTVGIDGRISPGNDSTRQLENKISASAPIYKTESDSLALSIAAGQTELGEKLLLESGRRLPSEFNRFEVGGQYSHKLENNRSIGARASMGYAGDDTSKAIRDASYSLSLTYGYPSRSKGYWIASVFMANNSPLANFVPIPGIMYMYKGETFSGLFGFPISSMQWTPVNPWAFSLSLFGVNVQTEAAYGHADNVQSFFTYSFAQSTFVPSERNETRDRLTILEQKAGLGFRLPITSTFVGMGQAELQAGRSFGRSVFIGQGMLNRDGGSVDLNDDWYLSWSLKFAF